jgi:hypothetical protein
VKKLTIIIAAFGGGRDFLSALIPHFLGGEAAVFFSRNID